MRAAGAARRRRSLCAQVARRGLGAARERHAGRGAPRGAGGAQAQAGQLRGLARASCPRRGGGAQPSPVQRSRGAVGRRQAGSLTALKCGPAALVAAWASGAALLSAAGPAARAESASALRGGGRLRMRPNTRRGAHTHSTRPSTRIFLVTLSGVSCEPHRRPRSVRARRAGAPASGAGRALGRPPPGPPTGPWLRTSRPASSRRAP